MVRTRATVNCFQPLRWHGRMRKGPAEVLIELMVRSEWIALQVVRRERQKKERL